MACGWKYFLTIVLSVAKNKTIDPRGVKLKRGGVRRVLKEGIMIAGDFKSATYYIKGGFK